MKYNLTITSLICILCLCFASSLSAQDHDSTHTERGWIGRTANKIFGNEHPPDKPHFLIYPTLGYAPETALEIGASTLYLFYAKNDYKRNRLSEINLFSFFTTKSQYGLWLDHAIFGDQDNWFFLGEVRQQRFPLLYFGIGPETLGDEPNLIDANYTLIRERILKNIAPNLFMGLEIDFQRLYNAEFERPPSPEPLGMDGSSNLGLGLGIVYDNRQNVLNEREGIFAEIAYETYRKSMGSAFNFEGLYMEIRKFIPMTADKKQVLALHAKGSFLTGDVPFNQLALLGGEFLMRGYYKGRYRDKNYVAAQAEYRFLPFPFSKRLGAAAFISAGAVSPRIGDLSLARFVPAGGIGLRFLLFPQKDIFVRLDFAIQPEGNGIYFFTGEAF